MFLIGLPLSLIGLALGIGSIIVSAKGSSVFALGILATFGNATSATYFLWLYFVRGLC